MTVRQIMNSNVVFLTPDDTVVCAAKMLSRHDIGMLPVCSKDGKLRGVVTDRDIALRCVALGNPAEETKVREIMTRGIVTAAPSDEVADAAKVMASEKVRRLPVVENNKLIGIFSLADMVQQAIFRKEASYALNEISSPKYKYKKM